MAIAPFLAVTAAEMREDPVFPSKTAWLGCQFSSWNPGLCNFPKALPPESLLILTDQFPFENHDPELILHQLQDQLIRLSCCALLLDFQKPEIDALASLIELLAEALPCPVIVSACYGQGLECPVFLPPVPPSVSLNDWLSPWLGREIWLELALDGEFITITDRGSDITPLPYGWDGDGFSDNLLNCHYRIQQNADAVTVTLWRTRADLTALIDQAEALGVSAFVGWNRELHSFPFQNPL